MKLIPLTDAIWKGDLWSDLLFKIHDPREHRNDDITMHDVSAQLQITEKLGAEKSYSETSSNSFIHTIPCSQIEFTDRPTIVFQRKSLTCAKYLSSENRAKISRFFKDNTNQIIRARVHKEVLGPTTSSLNLSITIKWLECELSPALTENSITDFNNINNFIVPEQLSGSTLSTKQDLCNSFFGTTKKKCLKTRVICGVSSSIRVVEYKLCVQENFANSVCTLRHGLTEKFEWYCKTGGENSGIGVVIHLKDSLGAIFDNFPTTLPVKVELVYDDGSSAPFFPIAPLKDKKSISSALLPLFRPLQPEPILGLGTGSQFFCFRIEEVSFHHQGHSGFTIRVSPADDTCSNVLAGTMAETLIIKSKPKPRKIRRSKGGRTTSVQSASVMTICKYEKGGYKSVVRPRKVSLQTDDISATLPPLQKDRFPVKEDFVSHLFTDGRRSCVLCNADLSSCSGLCLRDHKEKCAFRKTLLPNLQQLKENYENVGPIELLGR